MSLVKHQNYVRQNLKLYVPILMLQNQPVNFYKIELNHVGYSLLRDYFRP